MAEPTVNNDNVDIQKDEPQSQNSSEDTKVWDEKYPKWQKMLSKEYWGDSRLEKYDSLKSVIEDAVNPKSKAPEKYDVTDSELEKVLRAGDVSNDTAKEIEKIIQSKTYKPKTEDSLKEVIGLADYEVSKAYAEKAYSKVLPESLKEEFEKSDIKNDPLFFKFAEIVGKNLGDEALEDFKAEKTPTRKSNDPFMDLLLGGKNGD